MSFENLLLHSGELIQYMRDNGYSESYILLLKTEINWLKKNGDSVDSYESACMVREGQTYYSIVPRLADKIQAKTEAGFNEIVPEVWDEED